ncbi:MAG: hypothetical protein H0U74_20640 [Bradymonadaceae bacterium]|nr:hypothetical protein [Lujinxingiaceae bacterium]
MPKPTQSDQEGQNHVGELDALAVDFARAESTRRRRAIFVGLACLGALVLTLWGMVNFRDTLFRPDMQVEAGERSVLAETNDPQCRELIARVTTVGDAYFAAERAIERELLGDDLEVVVQVSATLKAIRSQLVEIGASSSAANLRYENSRAELDNWFVYVDRELELLIRLSTERLSELGPGEPEEAQDTVEPAAAKKKAASKPVIGAEELRQRALLAVHESFQSFRVWHSSEMHPCGKAPEGVTPWRSES